MPRAQDTATGAARSDPASALREADRAFCEATRADGLEGWLDWFAPDAVVFPPRDGLAVGAEAVRAHYSGMQGFPAPGFLWEPLQAGIASSGDLGWTIGHAGSDASGTAVWNGGEYLTVWRKQPDGRWRVVSDCGFDARFGTTLGLAGAPRTIGRESEHVFRSRDGDLTACIGSWWASDDAGGETGGTFLSVWRRAKDGGQELVAETGVVQPR